MLASLRAAARVSAAVELRVCSLLAAGPGPGCIGNVPSHASGMPQQLASAPPRPGTWGQLAHFSSTSSNEPPQQPPPPGAASPTPPQQPGDQAPEAGPQQQRSATLAEALDRLVDAAVALVEQGKAAEAVAVLKQGIDVLEASYPGSAEVGELHNQAALLLYLQARCDEAGRHASTSLDITRAAFGSANMLTAHRLVRLGTIKFGQGRVAEAAELLQEGARVLATESGEHDPGRAEADFYLALCRMASGGPGGAGGVREAVQDAEVPLMDSLQRMKRVLGAESMVISLALTQHGRVVLAVGSGGDLRVTEAAYRQHQRLQRARDPGSEDTSLAGYKLAVLYYAHDLLPDARGALQEATQLLRALFPEEHDLVVLCKHRLGMIAAAAGDHRAARQLLEATAEEYRRQDPQHPLAAEADLGLAAARLRVAQNAAVREEVVAEARGRLEAMAAGLGQDHLLVQAASRLYAKLHAQAQQR